MCSDVFSGKVIRPSTRLFHLPSLSFVVANLLLILALPASAADAGCDSENGAWAADQQYRSGEMVFYHGQWYQAGALNQTHKPGTDPLSWRPLATTPDCSHTALVPKTSDEPALDTSPADRPESRKGVKTFEQAPGGSGCDKAPVWTLSQSYAAGAYVVHEGQTYRAITASQGDLPGVAKPPHWVAVDNDCPKPSAASTR